MRVASVPRMRMEVFPTPDPSSLKNTSDGMPCRIAGMFRAAFSFLISAWETLLYAIGVFFPARVEETTTSSRCMFFKLSVCSSA